MKLLDSSALIAYYNSDDAHHDEVRKLQLDHGAINELVFSEVATVLSRRKPKRIDVPDVMKHINAATAMESVGAIPFTEWLAEFSERIDALSFTDCSLLIQARNLGWKLVTFDEALKKAARSEGIIVEPM